MKTIPLTKGYSAIVDDDDYERLMIGPKWYVCIKGSKLTPLFYAVRNVRISKKKKTVQYMHHLILEGPIDHINGNGLDNRKVNLRNANQHQNMCNTRTRFNKCGFRGITKMYENGYRATISISGRTKYVGIYSTAEEAAKGRDAAARKQYGEFARLNFPI